jgi:hypothetical protein
MSTFDPDKHFVVVRSKVDGHHDHVDLRTLDTILESIGRERQAAPATGVSAHDLAAFEERIARQVQALAVMLDQLRSYVHGQTLADLAFQHTVLLDSARTSGDPSLVAAAEESAAIAFGIDWQSRIASLLNEGQRLDAAALRGAA